MLKMMENKNNDKCELIDQTSWFTRLMYMLNFWPTLVQSVLLELWPQMDFNLTHLTCGRSLENLKTQCGNREVLLISLNSW